MSNPQLTSAAFNVQLAAQSATLQQAQTGSQTASQTRAAADDFETVFLQTMLSPMFAGTSPSEPFGGGFAEETWQGLMVEEYAQMITGAGGIGISDAIYSELMSIQEQAHDHD